MMKLPICLKQNNNPGNELVVSTLSLLVHTRIVCTGGPELKINF